MGNGNDNTATHFWEYHHPLSEGLPLLSIVYPVTAVVLYLTYCVSVPLLFGGRQNSSDDESTALWPGCSNNHDLRTRILKKFNQVRILIQTLIAAALIFHAIRDRHDFFCTEIPGSSTRPSVTDPQDHTKIVWWIWLFYIVKILDLLDGIFIIWNSNTVNALQIYHHTSLVIMSWIGVKYYPGGSTLVPIVINCLSQFGFYIFHQINKNRAPGDMIAFGTALYGMQVIQFSLILLHTSVRIIKPCGYPTVASIGLQVYIAIFAISVIYFWYDLICGALGSFWGRGGGRDDGNGGSGSRNYCYRR